jgi:hydrogenase-4 transcriptional activator
MSRSSILLRMCLEGARQHAGARGVWVYTAASAGATTPLLLRCGDVHDLGRRANEVTIHDLCLGGGPPSEEVPPIEEVRSPWPECRLVRVSLAQAGVALGGPTGLETPSRRRTDRGELATPTFPPVLVGLCFAPGAAPPASLDLLAPASGGDLGEADWSWRLVLIATLAVQLQQVSAVLDDPVSGLPGRSEFLATVEMSLEGARDSGEPMTLLLVNPDDFAFVNERFGAEAGDSVIREVARRLRASQRSTDLVARHGGAIFAAAMPGTPIHTGRSVAEKIRLRLSDEPFLDGALRLGFSVGVTAFDAASDQEAGAVELIRRADQALFAAKRAGGGRVVAWEERWAAEEVGAQDRLSGVFTGNISRDYRKMALLLDTVGAIAASSDYAELAGQVVENLFSTLHAERVGIYRKTADGELTLLRGLKRDRGTEEVRSKDTGLLLDATQRRLLIRAAGGGPPLKASTEKAAPDGSTFDSLTCVVPLAAGGVTHGCLILEGRADTMTVDESDLDLLRMLASQLAIACDRAGLAEQERRRQEAERRRLQDELELLRGALQESKLVYRSEEMEAALGIARRVAPTDATVLLTGESGTGKELFARTIHEASPRRKRPMVVVDCGAIPTSLIESELFGHEKGAYTGASQRKLGRLVEAAAGTVLLDEISELPLEVQSKLLRFVQEKQLTPVGGSRPQAVDVRVIAASNRDLSQEVAAGRFREDLYHRLNVVRILVPALRDRPDDILLLAEHFVELYTLLYHKTVRRLTPEAEALLMQYAWPGNVRELQNRIMQAVILCEGPELGVSELGLPVDEPSAAPPRARGAPAPAPRRAGPAAGPVGAPEDSWEALRVALARQVRLAGSRVDRLPPPLGRWLGDDLFLEANTAAGGVARRGARRLGVPATTFRRRLNRALSEVENKMAPRPAGWDEVRQALSALLGSRQASGDLLRRVQRLLLDEVQSHAPEGAQVRSALLGITLPTYRRRLMDGP